MEQTRKVKCFPSLVGEDLEFLPGPVRGRGFGVKGGGDGDGKDVVGRGEVVHVSYWFHNPFHNLAVRDQPEGPVDGGLGCHLGWWTGAFGGGVGGTLTVSSLTGE